MISSTSKTITYFCYFCTFSLCFYPHRCSAKDNITKGENIHDGADYLESGVFQMGFFSGKGGRYLGIWYAKDTKTVVWVANRDDPVPDATGVLTIAEDGDVKVLDKNQKIYFNTNKGGASKRTLKLFDTGNAVLIEKSEKSTFIWQSFLHPTDTFLQGMNMDLNLKLISWKSPDDPSPGSFVFQEEKIMQYDIMNGTAPRWKSGSGSKNKFPLNQMFPENYSRLLMHHSGNIQYLTRVEPAKDWNLVWEEPKNVCSNYQVCGPYGLCSPSNQTKCSCLLGFEAIESEDNSAGCRREHKICSKGGVNDEFQIVSMIEVSNPTSFESTFELRCKRKCLENCKCRAYSYTRGNTGMQRGRPSNPNRCRIWESDLYNLQMNGTDNISIRVSRGGTGGHHNSSQGSPSPHDASPSFLTKTRILVFAMTTLVILLLCSLSYIYYKRVVPHEQGRNSMLQTDNSERRSVNLVDLDHSREDNIEGIRVPFFEFESILAATDNFSDANKLGEGGFGPVYKGKLPEGIEVAVKRLSSLSGQGLEEFKNEVILIAKLQHRNLVRLLGYCMKGNEKMLVYEYMPNKSLDAFIFDQEPSPLLNWAKRYEIIIGIARGLLYLHQDSRLRIIHRDLKTSNILLDEELNPKISDFGLAKIVKDREMEASTNRVIGTYGYMAPEYALDGLFSTKSDVFSFGVVVLEIISGKKNTQFFKSQQTINLLGYAWSLWKEDRPFELMDQKLVESSNSSEVLKCIIVGLLCVQEDPGDRPTMTNVVLMLAGDIASLPTPKQPAFVARKTMSSSSSSSYKPDQTQTNNSLTVTLQEGR
ncbi:hypothetical protein L6452_15779 [Arctium lappa]|uniref:Uncharacterized protein n=1 Tax=Arctium lappa TaxID=4217 RepID=A0ACB9CPT7_ARCLA|nr:hypothetical protein L6452_15779 [Arctium lappa]